MNDSKEMYYKLFNQISDTIDELETIQRETEEMYLLQEEDKKIILINLNNKN